MAGHRKLPVPLRDLHGHHCVPVPADGRGPPAHPDPPSAEGGGRHPAPHPQGLALVGRVGSGTVQIKI